MIRLFVALSAPDETAAVLARLQEGVRAARWRPREALHLTLRFVGEIDEAAADDLDEALEAVRGPAPRVSLAGVGAFEEKGVPHALYAAVEPDPALTLLRKRCESAARRAGLAPDTRPFRPHVTLAYLPAAADPVEVGRWIQHNNLARLAPFTPRSFGLYSSRLGKEGSTYRLERSYGLA